jgi:hypothetical protein
MVLLLDLTASQQSSSIPAGHAPDGAEHVLEDNHRFDCGRRLFFLREFARTGGRKSRCMWPSQCRSGRCGSRRDRRRGNLRTCQWHEVGKSSFDGKMVQIDIMGQMGTLSPIDRFNNAKQPVPRITKTLVEGVGDDAYYIENPSFTSINVRKGTSAFEVHVRGAAATQLKPILKILAQQAASKL